MLIPVSGIDIYTYMAGNMTVAARRCAVNQSIADGRKMSLPTMRMGGRKVMLENGCEYVSEI
jgi:hypothetical protein